MAFYWSFDYVALPTLTDLVTLIVSEICMHRFHFVTPCVKVHTMYETGTAYPPILFFLRQKKPYYILTVRTARSSSAG